MKVLFTNLSKKFYQQPKSRTVEQKRLLLALPDLGIISLQTRNKLQKALEVLQTRNCLLMSNKTFQFCYKDSIPKELISGVVYKFECALCNESDYSESIKTF